MLPKPPLRFIIVIVLLWALPAISTDIYLPSMPNMAHYFHTNLSILQYSIFFYTIGFSLGALFFGPISDRVGRRPVVLWNLAFAVICTSIIMVSTSLTMLFIARFFQGVALVGVGSTMRAITKDICPDKESMAKFGAILGISIPIASAVAPIIGGYIEEYFNWRVNFVFVLIYVIIFLVYSIKHLHETNHTKLERPFKFILTDYKEVLLNGVFFRYNAITAFALSSMFAYLTISPYLLQVKVGLSPERFGYSNLLISVTLIISSYINSKMIYHRGVDKMLKVGTIMLGTSGILFALAGLFHIYTLTTILIPMVVMVCGCGFIYPNASAGGLSLFAKSAGTASAIYACIQMLGGAVGSGIISLISHYGNALIGLGGLIILQGVIGTVFAKQLIIKNKIVTNL